MKKSVLVGIGIIALAVGGIFFGSEIVDATNKSDNPSMTMTVNEGEKKIAYTDTIFQFEIEIEPGKILFDATNPVGEVRILNKNYIIIKENANITLEECYRVDGTEVTSLGIEGNKVNLGEIKYNRGAGDSYYGETVKVIVKFKANKDSEITNFSELFSLEYENLKGEKGKTSIENKVDLEIKTIEYINGAIEGKSINDIIEVSEIEPLEVPVNKEFSMKYTLGAGQLGDDKSVTMDIKDRELIYLIDSSVIDKQGGNDETARISIKKALEDIKQNKPDTKGSLVVYGEVAKIIEVDDKTILSIDQMIAEIDKIEAADESGNLGDGIRKAKYLANENKGVSSSIVVVSNGNPNYYTQISEGNTSLLETRVNKDGVAKFDREKAVEYTNNIVNDIAINEEDDTRWYGINYAIEDQELLLNDSIEKLDGNIETVKSPYYDDFKTINENALVPIQIVAKITAEVAGLYKDKIEINMRDTEQELIIGFDIVGEMIVPTKEVSPFKVRAKFNSMLGTEGEYINMADPNIIKVSAKVEIEGAESIEFNEDEKGGYEWNIKPVVDTLIYKGLFNGRLQLDSSNIEPRDNILKCQIAASEVLDQGESFDLAEENYYSAGIILNVLTEKDFTFEKTAESKYKMYRLEGNTFIDITTEPLTAEPGYIYLITIDDYIENGSVDVNGGSVPFETGININPEGPEGENDNWGTIEVVPVPKPDHF